MSTAPRATSSELIHRLPAVRGRLSIRHVLAKITWFAVGGPADVLFKPADSADLAQFLSVKPADIPVTVIGVGSNLLVRDGGIRGVVIRLGRTFATLRTDGTIIHAGAAALDQSIAQSASDAGLGGLEFLSGIPGTLGGAIRMNAGAYGREIRDILISAEVLDPQGISHRLSPEDLKLSYRHSSLPEDWIVTGALLCGHPDDPATIRNRMEKIRQSRESSQPVRARTGGSTFANPEGYKAWELIDQAGCRGLRRGGAMVSEKHCNFLINTGDATAADLEDLGEDIRHRVKDTSGIDLRWEILRIGERAENRKQKG